MHEIEELTLGRWAVRLGLPLLCATLAAACGGADETAGERSGAARPEAAVAQADASSPTVFTAADLDALARGFAAEAAAVRAARERGAAARTPEERGAAVQDEWEAATIPRGAAAAGLPVERYREIRDTVDDVLTTLDFKGEIDGPLSIDLERVDAATRARLERDPVAALPEQSAAAFRARLDVLLPAWRDYKEITAVAG